MSVSQFACLSGQLLCVVVLLCAILLKIGPVELVAEIGQGKIGDDENTSEPNNETEEAKNHSLSTSGKLTSNPFVYDTSFQEGLLVKAIFSIHHDEDAEVYVNGELAASVKGYTTGYTLIPVSPKASEILRSAKTAVVAVHCHQTKGGQFIDVGFEGLVPATK